ncbi:hypothetical protein ACO22_06858 [Paracoccidioides brasiliensis]|uniref:Origin recognition complex subunit 4 n=1 Tax=Paracoccidioides brasiliensis TaxID=121759 RepID=A0A1D2J686_PARBR|nr:hypothetical protein ACO22_06858 [Paracoccidioides brasiliensis]
MGDFARPSRPLKRRKVAEGWKKGEISTNGYDMNGMMTGMNDKKSVRFQVESDSEGESWNLNGLSNGISNGDVDGNRDSDPEDERGEERVGGNDATDPQPEPSPSPSTGRTMRSRVRQSSLPKRHIGLSPTEGAKRPQRTGRKEEKTRRRVDEENVSHLTKRMRQAKSINGVDGTKVGTAAEGDGDIDVLRSKLRTRNKRTAASNRTPKGAKVWEVPTDDEVMEEELLDVATNELGEYLSAQANVEEYDDESQNDLSALQLQQELVDNDTHMVEADELPHYASKFKMLCEENELGSHVESLAQCILKKLTGKHPIPLRCLDSQYQTVHQLAEQTVVAGEGNSLLLLGSRGCGKTAVVESVISSLAKDHGDDFHVVRLNGFIHTDDRVALREIWRQLGREMNTKEETSKTISYADTMASLLALLSHPEELFGVSDDPNTISTAKSVIIVLDEFDLFAYHPRQTLLYNLFDIAQARKAPVAVLGLTTKVDVTENLEKRVKSRFSHRYVFLPRPRTFDEFSDICKAGMILEEGELPDGGLDNLKSDEGKLLLQSWEEYLQGLWADPAFQTHLQQIYHQTKSPKDFFASALLPISTLYHSLQKTPNCPSSLQPPTPKSFLSQPLSCPDPASLPFPPSTSSTSNTSLPLSLLLAATRLTALHEPGLNAAHRQTPTPLTLTFPAVYAEYVRLLTSAKVSASSSGAAATPGRVWGKDVAREAWERLVGWGLVVPVGGGTVMGDGRMFRIEISFEEVLDGVGDSGVGALGRWWRDT